jgi:iron complex transport system substrate-binding protein
MRRMLILSLSLCLLGSCADDSEPALGADDRVVLFGPSLVELFCRIGERERIVGIDRYSPWTLEAPRPADVGGYVDPNLEAVVSLSPTSIHSVGHSRTLQDLANELEIPYYGYDFDRLEDVRISAESICSRYGISGGDFWGELQATLDSLRRSGEGIRVMLVVDHLPGTATVTVAGSETFLGDIVEAVGSELVAPKAGEYPTLSMEGVLDLRPEMIVYLAPSVSDTASYRRSVKGQWSSFGYPSSEVRCLFHDFLLIPGTRLDSTAREIVRCLRS